MSARHRDARVPTQGWKLHVSAYAWTALALLDAVLAAVSEHHTAIKVIATPALLAALNSGDAGVGQVGKFITVYPSDDAQAVMLGRALADATRGLAGPPVLTDRLVAASSPVFYRYGAFGADMMQTALGEMFSALVDADGALVPDRREPHDATPSWVVDPFASERSEPVENTYQYFVLHELSRSSRTTVELALDVRELRMCVVKRYRASAESTVSGATERMRREAAALDRLRVLGDRVPQVFDLREGDEAQPDAALIMNEIPGEPLARYCRRVWAVGPPPRQEVMAIGTQLAELVGACHAAGIVHGDLKSANVFVDEDLTVRLVDFDGAQELGAAPRLPVAETRGYRAPRGEDVGEATDVYAIGAILFLLATGAEPSRAPEPDRLLSRRVTALNPAADPGLVAALTACLDPNPGKRPHVRAIPRLLGEAPARRPATRGRRTGAARYREYARRIGDRLSSEATQDRVLPGRRWTSRSHVGKGRVLRYINQGAAGAILALAEIATAFEDPDHLLALADAAAWLSASEAPPGPRLSGLHVGEAGVALALLRAGATLGDSALVDDGVRRMRATAADPHHSPDVFNGSAGRAFAHLVVWTHTAHPHDLDHARAAAEVLVSNAEWSADGGACWWTFPDGYGTLSGSPHYGYAHGAAGIADVLLDLYEVTGDPSYLATARGAIHWISSAEMLLGGHLSGWPAAPGGRANAPYWCHGATGIAIAAAHAARLDVIDGASDLAARAARAAAVGAHWAGPCYCHGLAGMLDVLLDWHAADPTAASSCPTAPLEELLLAFAVPSGSGTDWVTESPHIVTPDYLIGFAGIAPLLLRLTDPDRPRHLSLAGLGATAVPRGDVRLTTKMHC